MQHFLCKTNEKKKINKNQQSLVQSLFNEYEDKKKMTRKISRQVFNGS